MHAVSGISFDVAEGETLGLVGESGCGKSTCGRAIMALPLPTAGSVKFEGKDLTQLASAELRALRPQLQIIVQDPISSLNPLRRVADIIAEPLVIWHEAGNHVERQARVAAMMDNVGLDPDSGSNRPHEFSGGQCQRISIARALMLEPRLLICDEPVSALDVSVQAQILNLLTDMKRRYGLTMIFVAHDLAVVKYVSDRVAVMYLGKLCEIGGTESVYNHPAHPYTAALLASVPEPDPSAGLYEATLNGELPSPIDPPSGCRFRTRCPKTTRICAEEEPLMRAVGEDHFVACHHADSPPFNTDGRLTP